MAITKITQKNVEKILNLNIKDLRELAINLMQIDEEKRKDQLAIIIDNFTHFDIINYPNLFFITASFKKELEEMAKE